jgi:hypothetical protein
MTNTDAEIDWVKLLAQIDADPLPPIELASILSNVHAVDMKTAQDHVHTAIDDGTLIEKGDGFGDVELADPPDDKICTDEDGYIIDPEFSGGLEAVREHYNAVRDVIENMALLGGKYPTLGFGGNAGWYRTRDSGVVSQIEAGYTKRARCTTFERDFEHIVDSQLEADGRGREVFNVSSWKDPDAANAWKHCTPISNDDDEREWSGDGHPPEYADLRGFGFWVDLDLKYKNGRTELTEEELVTVERTQQRVINAVADAHDVSAGDVYALDSGGGAYVYGPPEATLPVIEYLDPEPAEWFLDDLADRINNGPLQQTIEEIVDAEGAGDLLDPDWIHNKNRQTKAPGAMHHSHDVVVTPLRDRHPDTAEPVTDVRYRPTLITEFSDSDIESLEAWADGLTTIEHTDAIGPLLRTLYPEHTDHTDGWRDVIDAVVDKCRREHERQQERQQERAEAIKELVADEDGAIDRPDIDADAAGSLRSSSGLVSGTDIVTSRAELSAAVDTIDVRDVIRTMLVTDITQLRDLTK